MNHMMIDLETLDTRPSTVVISIGAVLFNEDGLLPHNGEPTHLYRRLTWQDQLNNRRTVSESTIRWWLKQSDEARAALDGECVPLYDALEEVAQLYGYGNCGRVWANGTTFDISILEDVWPSWIVPLPWKYNAMRDMRTLKDLVPDDIMADCPIKTAHNALDDALFQAEFVVRAMKHIRRA